MRRANIVVIVLLALASAAAAQKETFSRSDPGLLSKTGRPQLVEFYHPG